MIMKRIKQSSYEHSLLQTASSMSPKTIFATTAKVLNELHTLFTSRGFIAINLILIK